MQSTIVEVEDIYPSRRRPVAEHIQRQDPVVYSRWDAEAPLDESQAVSYADNGYLLLENVFNDVEVAALQDALTALWSDQSGLAPETLVREPSSGQLRSIFQVHLQNTLIERVHRDARLVGIAEFLLGDSVYIHQSRINYKRGFGSKEFYWHSDFETWHVEDGMPRMRALSMSIALSENTFLNGPLMLMPGSHKSFLTCVGETPENHYKESLRKQEYGVPQEHNLAQMAEAGGIDVAIGGPGSVTVFDCNIMHGSNGNITPYPRSNLFFVYNSVDNRVVEPFCGLPPRPEFIATRNRIAPLTPAGGVII